MKLSALKSKLQSLETIAFELPSGALVPSHFHVTEVGKVSKHFIDCGGTIRKEEVVSLQLWNADDYDHRIHPEKLRSIIELSEKALGLGDLEIEVEYQGNTIEKFGLDFDGKNFLLTTMQTDCLAKDKCNVPASAFEVVGATEGGACCDPNSNCC